MNHSHRLIFFFIFICTCLTVNAQNLVTVEPANPLLRDSVTITFYANQGNKALADFDSTIYMHSGLITSSSASASDWKYAIGNWGTDDQPAKMKKVAANRYEKKILIGDYFQVSPTEEIKQMAFVFRNRSGSRVAKSVDNKDIFVPVTVKASSGKKNFLGNYRSHQIKDGITYIQLDTALIKLQPFTQSIVKITVFPDGKEVMDTSYSVVLAPAKLESRVADSGEFLDVFIDKTQIHIQKYPLRISYGSVGPNQKFYPFLSDENGFFTELNYRGFRFKLNDGEAIYGTGSRATALNKRGQKFNSYNTASYGYKSGASVLNVNIPFILSTAMYGLYFENHSPGFFDIGATNSSVLEYKVEQGTLSYYLIVGKSMDEILFNYTSLTGRQPLPPRWSLGFIQSKYGYQSDEEALEIVRKLKAEKFPIDGLVLDLYWFGSPKTMGNLDWDTTRFKSPAKFIQQLNKEGVSLIPITETFVAKTSENYDYLDKQGLLAKNKTGSSYVLEKFWAGPSGLIDIYQSKAGDWMWKKYKKQIDLGVKGWWCDLGEPESHPNDMLHSLGSARYVHNVYAQFWAASLAKGYQNEYPNQRLFNLIRSGYAGMQRYSTFPWSGDIQRSYSGLKTQVQIMLSMSLCGVSYMHSDLGGFTGGPKDQELYTRWLQFGSFCPIMRAHGEGVAPEPIFYDEPYKSIVRNYINLRYSLLPYNYSLSYLNSTRGTAIARPINYEEPGNQALSNVCDEYLWGPNFLIAPILDSAASVRKVVLPSGNWVEFATNNRFAGNAEYTIPVSLEVMPIFVKAGSIVPQIASKSSTKAYSIDTLNLVVYPDTKNWSSNFTLYHDDGESALALTKNLYELYELSAEQNEKGIQLNAHYSKNNSKSKSRIITYQLKLQEKAPTSVQNTKGTAISFAKDRRAFEQQQQAYYYDAASQTLFLKFVHKGEINSHFSLIY